MLQELKTLLLAAISLCLRLIAQIQSRIKARRYAANLVMLVKLSGRQKLSELNNFFLETITVSSFFFLPIEESNSFWLKFV